MTATFEEQGVTLAQVRVVAGVIVVDRRLLLGQRLPGTYGGLWCVPGGKVQDGETDQEALSRELTEELGPYAEVSVRDFIIGCLLPLGERRGSVSYFRVDISRYGPDWALAAGGSSWEFCGLGWFDAEQLRLMAAARMLAPADTEVVTHLCAELALDAGHAGAT